MALVREVIIRNREGLHFRPIMQLVDMAGRFQARLTVRHGERQADGRSPMDLLMLTATHGACLKLEAEGDDAEQALDALAKLIDSGFGET